MIKLKSLEFYENGFRKLKDLKFEFADRITIIAGHNGIGKSTILGLVSSTSGLNNPESLLKQDAVKEQKENSTEEKINIKSYFNKPFSTVIHDIIHLDPEELENDKLKSPWPRAVYEENTVEHWKNIRITKRGEGRLRSVSSTDISSPDKDLAGNDEKIPLPTLYLGMVRMLPVGESSENDIDSTVELMAREDAIYLRDFINKVIGSTAMESSEEITKQTIKNTKKSSNHPAYSHNSKSVSLGQDSLSSIATAVASFKKLKRILGEDYPGGLLVIDEIDAGFHPHAQYKLIDALRSAAKNLSLQIIATTHSNRLIEYIHPDSTLSNNALRIGDKVIYLADTATPRITTTWSLEDILSDMSLDQISPNLDQVPIIKAYLEDEEAGKFLKGILKMTTNSKTFYGHGNKKKMSVMPLGIGGNNLAKLPDFDPYFKETLLIVDADTTVPRSATNCIKLPPKKDIHSKGINPEKTIYLYIQELIKGKECDYPTTHQTLFEIEKVTSTRLTQEFSISGVNIEKRENAKSWFNQHFEKIKQYKIIELWAKDHKEQVKAFLIELEQKLQELIPTKKGTKLLKDNNANK